VDRLYREVRKAQVFVAVLGASRVTPSPRLLEPRAFQTGSPTKGCSGSFGGGTGTAWFGINLQGGGDQGGPAYSPTINETYAELAFCHYQDGGIAQSTALQAKGLRRSRDAGAVVERWILGPFYGIRCSSPGELNCAIAALLYQALNQAPVPGSNREPSEAVFEPALDRPGHCGLCQ